MPPKNASKAHKPKEEEAPQQPALKFEGSPSDTVRSYHDVDANQPRPEDAVKLRDILGDPMIRECWQFNYCFDVDYSMDVRSLVQVKVVHGSWKRESANRIRVEEACSRYPNVEPIVAYVPERFGTHHSEKT